MQRYRNRISGPILDRIDLCVELGVPTEDELRRPLEVDSNAAMAGRKPTPPHRGRRPDAIGLLGDILDRVRGTLTFRATVGTIRRYFVTKSFLDNLRI